MATDLGPLTLKLMANAEPMVAALARVQALTESSAAQIAAKADEQAKSVEALGARIGGALSKAATVGKAAFDLLAEALKNPATAIANLVGMVATGIEKIPYIGGVLALPFRAVEGAINLAVEAYKAGATRIKEIGKAAAMAGMTPEAFTPFSMMVGDINVAAVSGNKFSQALGAARMAAEGTKTAFDRIGLRTAEIAKMSNAGALEATLRRLGEVDGAVRAKAARELFGRGALALLPQLQMGPDRFAKVQETADKFGLNVTQGVIDSVRQVELVGKQLDYLKTGLTNQLAHAVAPVLAELADRIGPLQVGFGGLAETIINGMEAVGRAGAWMMDTFGTADMWEPFKIGWLHVEATILAGVGRIVQGFANGMAAVVSNYNSTLADHIRIAGKSVYLDMALGASNARTEAKNRAWFLEQTQNVEQWLANMGAGPETWGSKFLNVMDSIRERYLGIKKDIQKADPFGPFYDQLVEMENRLLSPLEKFRDGMDRLAQMRGFGMDLLSPGTSALRANELFQQLRGAYGMNYTPVGIMTQGSKEAFSTEMAYKFNATENISRELNRLTVEANRVREQQLEVGRKILDANKDGAIVRIKNIGG